MAGPMGEEAEEFLLLDEEEETPVSEKPEKEPFSLKSMFSSIKLPSLPKPKPKPKVPASQLGAAATTAGLPSRTFARRRRRAPTRPR